MYRPLVTGRDEDMKRFSIHEANMEKLLKKITTIRNKCEKYGCKFHFEEVGEEFKELENEAGETYTARFVIVEVEGIAIINGWKFIATVEHTEHGNIIRKVCDVKIPVKYYTSKPICEHCNSNRVRKDTYLVMNEETGEFKQVGKSCLKDFTRGMDAALVTQFQEMFKELEMHETHPVYESCKRYYKTETFLHYVAETIKHFGYVKADSQDRSTKERASDYFLFKEYNKHFGLGIDEELENELATHSFNPFSDENKKLVETAMNWIYNKSDTEDDYIHNLKVACSLEYIDFRKFGILASLFQAYNKDIHRQAKLETEKDVSNYVGTIGDKINILISAIECVTSWETTYGTIRIYKILGNDGNVFTCKTSNCITNGITSIRGTIKNHNEYRGVKQTALTRCRVF